MTPFWVLDTNVVVSAALTPGGVCARIMQHAIEGNFRMAWDNVMLTEYREVLSRPRFKLSPPAVRRLLAALPASGFRAGAAIRLNLPDPADLPFLAVACATDERIIVTGNPRHFPKATLRSLGVKVFSPRQALVALEMS